MLLKTADNGAFVLIFWFQSQVLFYPLWCTQKQVWLARSLHPFPPAPLPVSLSCKLLLSFTSNCLLSLSDEGICNRTLSSMDLYSAQPGRWPDIFHTSAPASARLHLCMYKLNRYQSLPLHLVFPCVYLILFHSLLFFFFLIFTLFNKAEHLASGHHMDGQLCQWSRWKSTPGHVKSEMALKLDEKLGYL